MMPNYRRLKKLLEKEAMCRAKARRIGGMKSPGANVWRMEADRIRQEAETLAANAVRRAGVGAWRPLAVGA